MTSRRGVSSSLPALISCVVGAGLILTAGCGGVNRLREAQSAFNEAAALENALRFDPAKAGQGVGSESVGRLASVRTGYGSALHSLEAIDSKEEQSLRDERLWGVALTLKALTYWRLGRYDEALEASSEATSEASDQLFPRDAAVLRALPGLIKTDLAYQQILDGAAAKAASLAKVTSYLWGDDGAQADLSAALAEVHDEHPVRVYLLQAKLAAHRNLRVAYQRLDDEANWPEDARTQAKTDLNELNQVLMKLGTAKEARDATVTTWARLLNVDP